VHTPSLDSKEKFCKVVEETRNFFQFLKETGCQGFDCAQQSIDTITNWGRPIRHQPESLEEIRIALADCHRCKLSKNRNAIVFGIGNPHARLIFIGEGPGYDEDQKGEPFVGAAGQLLTRIIHAIELTREKVYICNIIKCRPPENRNPMPDEIKTCFPFLKRQISAIQPEFICALGTIAAQTLIGSQKPISKLRGRFYSYMGIKLLPTYHPAYLLRNPERKREVWEDMKKLMKEMADMSG
jgi:DNA polymerase